MKPTKQILILTLLMFIFTLGLTCCVPPDAGMYCEPVYSVPRCSDGSYIEACVAYDISRCGYKVKGRMFYCTRCEPLICDAAAEAAVNYCYYSYYGTIEGDDQPLIDTDELVELLLNELEDLK